MDIYQFNQLSIDGKAEFAWSDGIFIQSVKEGLKGFLLFSTRNFYIEIEYDKKLNDIVQIRAFKKGQRLEKYIDSVELEKLF